MKLQELVDLINQSESIEKFAEDNFLRITTDGDKHILNYADQILWTPKNWISHYCRGLTLQGSPKNYRIIAKSFDRFYHLNENPEYLTERFDTSKPFEVQFKYDGSLILQYIDRVNWFLHTCIQTRWAFCKDSVKPWIYDGTYADLFEQSPQKNPDYQFPWDLCPGETAIYELCSPYNQVVDFYPEPFAVLLWVVHANWTERKEVFWGERYEVSSIEEVLELLKTLKPH